MPGSLWLFTVAQTRKKKWYEVINIAILDADSTFRSLWGFLQCQPKNQRVKASRPKAQTKPVSVSDSSIYPRIHPFRLATSKKMLKRWNAVITIWVHSGFYIPTRHIPSFCILRGCFLKKQIQPGLRRSKGYTSPVLWTPASCLQRHKSGLERHFGTSDGRCVPGQALMKQWGISYIIWV